MPFPELAVIAEGELPTGERWTVRAGRTPEDYELQPVATDSALGVNVFAALLPPGAGLVSLTGLDSAGQVVAD
jgi:hypothetical protein